MQSPIGNLDRAGQVLSRAVRLLIIVVLAAFVVGAVSIFVTWQSDYWLLRDRLVHIHEALFGPYMEPACRKDSSKCRNGRLLPLAAGMLTKAALCVDEPSLELHCQLYSLHEDLNRELFAGKMPRVVFTLQRKPNAAGYYSHRRFKTGGRAIDEIALNPSTFRNLSMRRLASTVAHEMCHQEIAHFGRPGKNGFHNMEWARCMIRIGLRPTATGRPGGAMTGKRVTHMIVQGGPFDRLATRHPLIGGRKVALSE